MDYLDMKYDKFYINNYFLPIERVSFFHLSPTLFQAKFPLKDQTN